MPDFPNRKVVYAFPDAPSQPVSCNNGMVMPSWFDIKAIPVNENEPDDLAGIDESIASIHGLIDKVIADNNLKPENVVLGGFSQGGAMSLMAGSTYHAQLGGVVCLSGWLLRKSSNVAAWSGPKASVPLFIGHGDADQVVLTSLGKEAADRIKAERDSSAGSAGVTFKTVSSSAIRSSAPPHTLTHTAHTPLTPQYAGEGHGACDDELKDLAQFFNEVLK